MGDTKAPPRLRSRQCMFVLYPESQQAAIDYCKQNLPCAWALHDKDVHTQAAFDDYVKKHEGTLPDWMPGDLKKPHIHLCAVSQMPGTFRALQKKSALRSTSSAR